MDKLEHGCLLAGLRSEGLGLLGVVALKAACRELETDELLEVLGRLARLAPAGLSKPA